MKAGRRVHQVPTKWITVTLPSGIKYYELDRKGKLVHAFGPRTFPNGPPAPRPIAIPVPPIAPISPPPEPPYVIPSGPRWEDELSMGDEGSGFDGFAQL
jgi:hypothetical protein